MKQIQIKDIEDVCNEQIKQVKTYFKMLEEHECLDRLDEREQFIMTMMPVVFKNKLFKIMNSDKKKD